MERIKGKGHQRVDLVRRAPKSRPIQASSSKLKMYKQIVKLEQLFKRILGNGSSKEDHNSEVKDGGRQLSNKRSIPIVSYPPKASKSSSLSVKMASADCSVLECMEGSFAKARVLYVPVEEIGNEGRLLRACQVIRDAFVKAGLVLERDVARALKLHATVMNADYRKSQSSKKVDSFDARGIYEEYGYMDWGVYKIRKAHLSQRLVYDKNGYYHCCASMPFP